MSIIYSIKQLVSVTENSVPTPVTNILPAQSPANITIPVPIPPFLPKRTSIPVTTPIPVVQHK